MRLLFVVCVLALLSQRAFAQGEGGEPVAVATGEQQEQQQQPEVLLSEEEEDDGEEAPAEERAAQEGLPPRELTAEEKAMQQRYMQHLLRRSTPPCRKELQSGFTSMESFSDGCKQELAKLQVTFQQRLEAEARGEQPGSGDVGEDGEERPRAKVKATPRPRKVKPTPSWWSTIVITDNHRTGATVLLIVLALFGLPIAYAYLTYDPKAAAAVAELARANQAVAEANAPRGDRKKRA